MAPTIQVCDTLGLGTSGLDERFSLFRHLEL